MKFLVFQHVPHEPPGFITQAAQEAGVALEIVELWKSYKLPDVDSVDGLIIMGGPMGVYEDKDKYPSKNDELLFIKKALGQIPILGFCLGGQLLANALGAKVYPNVVNNKRLKEIGYYDVELTEEGLNDPIFKGFTNPVKVLQWHGDVFDMPEKATLLATYKDCPHQAFRYGDKAYGMLFHFEFTPEMVSKQIEMDREWIHDGFEIDEDELKKQAKENENLMKTQCKQLLMNFLTIR